MSPLCAAIIVRIGAQFQAIGYRPCSLGGRPLHRKHLVTKPDGEIRLGAPPLPRHRINDVLPLASARLAYHLWFPPSLTLWGQASICPPERNTVIPAADRYSGHVRIAGLDGFGSLLP